jgi:hypothetical protein
MSKWWRSDRDIRKRKGRQRTGGKCSIGVVVSMVVWCKGCTSTGRRMS